MRAQGSRDNLASHQRSEKIKLLEGVAFKDGEPVKTIDRVGRNSQLLEIDRHQIVHIEVSSSLRHSHERCDAQE